MSRTTNRLFLVLFTVYVVVLAVATVGELFDVQALRDLFDLKALFAS